MVFTDKILSWRFLHLNVVGFCFKEGLPRGSRGYPSDYALALDIADAGESSPRAEFSITQTELRFGLLFHLELRSPSRSLASTTPEVEFSSL